MVVEKNPFKRFVFRALLGFCLFGMMPIYAFESSPFATDRNFQVSAIDQLVLFSTEMDSFGNYSKKESYPSQVARVQEPSSQTAQANRLLPEITTYEPMNQGNLPLPVAQVSASNSIRQELQQQKVGDLGGSPYGQLTGKSTFGKVEDDSSFQNLIQERGTASSAPLIEDGGNLFEGDGPMTQEQILEAENKVALFRDEISKVAFKMEPYQQMDYKAYENAKNLFMKNEKIISRLNDFEEGFVKNAKELFVNYSWRDMDKAGKRPYEAFIERQEARTVFPYPKGQEPKPTTHQGGISH